MEFEIKRADTADIPTIHAMAQVVFRDTYRTILSPQQLDYMLDWMYSPRNLEDQIICQGHNYFIAWQGETPAGYVSFNEDKSAQDGRRVFHLQKIYVMPAYQGQGLGSALFDHALACIRGIGGQRVELNVNRENPALQFYLHKGMKKARQGDFPIGQGYYMNDYIMSLDL